MLRRCALGALVLVALVSSGARSFDAASPAPVLVELFTSEGCSSCPPADRLLARIADAPLDGAVIVALGEHVDYWDQLGWRDRFSSSAYTERQQMYARRFGIEGPYTPQLVIDGRAECVGSDAPAVQRAIASAASAPHGVVTIDVRRASPIDFDVILSAADLPQKPGDRAEILIAVTEDALRSNVTRGENHGRTLTHAAVVRQLANVGEAVGAAAHAEHAVSVAPGWRRDRLHVIAFVQQRRGGPVMAAASVPLVARP